MHVPSPRSLAIRSGYAAVLPEVEHVLGSVGRMKYLLPLYTALADNPETRALARKIFQGAAHGYHNIARAVVKGRLDSLRPADTAGEPAFADDNSVLRRYERHAGCPTRRRFHVQD